jgi:hypothetical protein
MLIIDEYQIGQYRKPLYNHGATIYIVPEKIIEKRWDAKTNTHHTIRTITGRKECGQKLHEARNTLKKYQEILRDTQDDEYIRPMKNRRVKEGFDNPIYDRYTAKKMIEDKKFNPTGNVWRKRFWPNETWAEGSPEPMMNEPYWDTTHAVQKGSEWIDEHLMNVSERSNFNDIFEVLDEAYITLGAQTNQITFDSDEDL